MSIEDSANRFLDGPENDKSAKDDIRSLLTSHLITGMSLQEKGLLNEAIEEFTKENNRPIHADIDKEILQKSYWHIGMAYKELGQLDNAEEAFQQARELLKLYRVGVSPHYNLAEIFIGQGRIDEAIDICQESLNEGPDGGVKQLLAIALEMKKNSPRV
jgi:tetratricopeptide (TPR) repeat protein